MKSAETVKHHKMHKHTLSGLLLGGMLLIASGIEPLVLKVDSSWLYATLVPGLAIILRSWRPPMGVLRTCTTLLGGFLVGITPVMVKSSDTKIIYSGMLGCLLGAVLLGISFTEKPIQD